VLVAIGGTQLTRIDVAENGPYMWHKPEANYLPTRRPLSLLSDEGLRIDVATAEGAIQEITCVDPRPWFRCPFGDGSKDVRVLDLLAGMGYPRHQLAHEQPTKVLWFNPRRNYCRFCEAAFREAANA
jgi:hypothetical protein